jgi:hypothetical protein
MFSPARRFSWACLLASLAASSALAQAQGPARWQSAGQGQSVGQGQSAGQARYFPTAAHHSRMAGTTAGMLRPVPREASRTAPPVTHHPQREGWNLKWRRSEQVAERAAEPIARRNDAPDVFDPPVGARAVADPSSAAPPAQSNVAQTAWLQPQQDQGALELPPNLRSAQPPEGKKVDLFSDPFADELPAAQDAGSQDSGELQPPAVDSTIDPVRPSESRPMNELRSGSPPRNDSGDAATTSPNDSPLLLPPSRASEGPSFGDMLRQETPDAGASSAPPTPPQPPATAPPPPAPAPKAAAPGNDEPFENPFNQRPRTSEDTNGQPLRGEMMLTEGVTCDVFRTQIARETIDQLSLDISPPYRPDVIDPAKYDQDREDFLEKQSIRKWQKPDGTELATGRLRDLAYENVVIETEYGALEQLPVDWLSEGDLAYLSENWGLPKECLLEQVAYTPRSWTAMTMTWKASDLCHKPMYFEEVNLERYGHTAGPVLQPVVSSAHFFANIAVLPYKMGVHTPRECQYALGYYRPGDCAPWIVPPVPISLRGGLSQAAVMTGMFWLIP